MYNDYMYAIDRSDEYLEHYGIKGMKWGVRKAIASGNSKRLDRQYRKASKKLAKLKARANNGEKYARRASRLGAAGAVASGLALAGTGRVGRAVEAAGTLTRSIRNKNLRTAGQAVATAGDTINRWGQSSSIAKGIVGSKAGKAITDAISNRQINALKNSRSIREAAAHLTEDQARKMAAAGNTAGVARLRDQAAAHLTEDQARKIFSGNRESAKKMASGVSNNTIARIGAGAVGAGLLGAAGYNAYRAATTKRAAKKAAQFESEMNKAFAGTKYGKSSGSKKRRRRS